MLTDLQVELIEIIFFYLIDSRICYSLACSSDSSGNLTDFAGIRTKTNFKIIHHLRLVNQRFLSLTSILFQFLKLNHIIGSKVYRLYQNGNLFWRKYLPYVGHLDLCYIKIIYVNNLSYVNSLDIYYADIEEIKLIRLKHLFCNPKLDISHLTKTNIHYHESTWNDDGVVKYYYNDCQQNRCLIRHLEFV